LVIITMTKALIRCLFIISMTVFASSDQSLAQEDTGKDVIVTGRVVDTACYMRFGQKGESHRDCALMCAREGQTFGILDEKNDILYQIIAGEPGADPNKPFMDYAEEMVTVKGKLYEKSQFKAILPIEVKKAPDP